ncbi:MAG: hypothetical protein PHG94_02115 [Syntrophomonas sp.]|nr:hypothetical protein [Syntrophomonas sp.]
MDGVGKLNLLVRWQRSPNYWRLRQLASKLKFKLMRVSFSSKQRLQDINEQTSITKALARGIAWKVCSSIAVVIILELLEHLLKSSFQSFATLTNILQFARVGQSFPYDTLFGVIAAITGLFLGLYFAAISSLVSGVYSTHPGTLLKVFLREKAGNHYIQILSFLTVYSIILLCYISLGGVPGIINTVFVTLLCCYSIYCFTLLGTRVFSFFDPAQLANTVFYDINKAIKSATINGFAWKDMSFQAHYHNQAKQAIDTFAVLVNFGVISQQAQEISLLDALKRSIYLLINYQNYKARIPSDSYWFHQRYEHPDWFLANSSELGIALQTSTALQPKLKSDNYWLEKHVFDVILFALKEYLKRDDLENAYLVLDTINLLLEELGHKLEIKLAIKLLKAVDVIINEYIEQISFNGKDNVISDVFWMAFIDCYGLLYISPLLGFVNEFGTDTKNAFHKLMASVNWNSSKGAYETKFPYRMIDRLEYVFDHLKFEKSVEGQIISPSWYLNQLIVGRFAELVDENTSDLVAMAVEFYKRKTELLYQRKQYAACTVLGHRGLEWCRKSYHHVGIWPILSNTIDEYYIRKELSWPKWNWEELKTQISNLEKDIYIILARCLPVLVESSQEGKIPDLFGQTYHIICLAIYQALKVPDTETVKALIPAFFLSALQANEVLRKKTAEWKEPTSSLIFATEPIADLMELSGYALIYSELHEIHELWHPFKTCWDSYFLTSYSDPTQAARYLNDLNSIRQSIPELSPHSLIFSSWKNDLNRLFESKKLISDYRASGQGNNGQKLLHKSPLIRALSYSRNGFFGRGTDLFLLVYVAEQTDSNVVSIPDRFGIRQQIEKEKERDKYTGDRNGETEEPEKND